MRRLQEMNNLQETSPPSSKPRKPKSNNMKDHRRGEEEREKEREKERERERERNVKHVKQRLGKIIG